MLHHQGQEKTTLIERVIGCLVARGLRIGAIKHDAHNVELDRPGKDSWRLREAGAVRTILAANNQLAVFDTAEQPRRVRELAEQFLSDVDVVIAEGFRTSGEPTIIVERVDGPIRKDWEPPVAPIAIVSDGLTAGTLPVLGAQRARRSGSVHLPAIRDRETRSVAALRGALLPSV